jgi:hypothetical protein
MVADQATRRTTTIGTRKLGLDGPKSPADGKRINSIYDSYTWQAKYADPGFHKHVRSKKPYTDGRRPNASLPLHPDGGSSDARSDE